jgi:hypothetical protein
MKLRFHENIIKRIAARYEYLRNEDEVISLKEQIQKQGFINKEQLKLVAYWKAPRSAGHVGKNEDGYIQDITSFALSSKNERSRIEVLTILDGVSWPTASVLLHLFHRDPYPILDFRALWSAGLEVPKLYNFEFWLPYVFFCRGIAHRNNVSMRDLDRAMWQYSKENQKTLDV